MTGGGLLELILLSMAWLLFVGGIAANWHVLRRQLKRKSADEQVPSGLGFVPGVVGSLRCHGRGYGSRCRSCSIPIALAGSCFSCSCANSK